MSEQQFSPAVQAAQAKREEQQKAADLRRQTVRDLARVAFGAAQDFEPSSQDVDEVQRALSKCYARHQQRQAVANAPASQPRRWASIAARNF